jgi:hypothetical protein
MTIFYFIYKITNLLNNKYYIGRHATTNINDKYMGSGVGIKNAIKKYGVDNFSKEIIAFANSAEELWELESIIVDETVVHDKMSYNNAFGGKNWIYELKKKDKEKFILHQKNAGFQGALAAKSVRTKEWHQKGGSISRKKIAELFNYQITFPSGDVIIINGNELKGFAEKHNLSFNTLHKYAKLGTVIPKGKCIGYMIKQIGNPGHYKNTNYQNYKINALKRKKYICALCEKNNLDGGNLKQHLFKKHNFTEKEYKDYKNEHL